MQFLWVLPHKLESLNRIETELCFFLFTFFYARVKLIEMALNYNIANKIFEYEFLSLAIILDNKKIRRSPHKIYKHRSEEGAMNILVDSYLMDDETKFMEYFRSTPHLFCKILDSIKKSQNQQIAIQSRQEINYVSHCGIY